MNRLILSLLLLLSINLFGQNDNTLFSKIKINLEGKNINDLAKLGVEVDHGIIIKGRYIINDYSEYEIQDITSAGFEYEVLIEDVKAWYKDQNRECDHEHLLKSGPLDCFNGTASGSSAPVFETPVNYTYGSMGGYVTYSEMLEVLDSMVSKFPNLITPRNDIGTVADQTWMGNSIFWMKISDNPNTDETTEPEVLFTSLHHAREPNSLSQNLFYMWYLLENYSTNAEVAYLVDNTEIYFIPCVNPDGYLLNEMNDPTGGGLIRKNARDNNGDGVYNQNVDGVDLNRNYGFAWGFDNSGSSPNANSQTYRGPSAFSEPETQAVKMFCDAREIEITMNYHTYGNLLIHPWGYTDDTTSEHGTFSVFGEEMTQYNNYTFGTGTQTVGYVVNGDSDDWMYGETVSKGKIYSMTPEAGEGSAGFWPMSSQIDEFNKANMHQNLSVSRLVLNYVEAEEINAEATIGNSGSFDFNCLKKGLKAGNVTVDFTSLSPNLTLTASPQVLSLVHLASQNINVPFSVSSSAVSNDELKFLVSVDNGLHTYYDTIVKTFIESNFVTVFSDNTNSLSNWTTGGWNTTTEDFYSSPNCITDSPNSNHSSNQSKSITLGNPIDLSNASYAKINFWAKWDIENDYDYAQVLISTDNGANFIPLCGLYSNEGTNNQDDGMPLYDNIQNTWVKEEIDITEYIGGDALIRFYFYSDNFVNEDGFYFDDFEVSIIETAHAHNISASDYTCDPNNTGTAVDTFTNQWGLDSIVTLNTVFADADSTYVLEFTTNTSDIGIQIDSLMNVFGCDSVVYTETKINPGMNIFKLESSTLSIYPNPVKDILTIEMSGLESNLDINILNTIGQSIKKVSMNKTTETDLSHLKKGIYFIQFKINNEVKTIKFLKQ